METTFARWLRERGETHFEYATRLGLSFRAISRLAGISREPYAVHQVSMKFVVKVSIDTDIPVNVLIEDAAKAGENPIAPRRYTKRTDRAAAE